MGGLWGQGRTLPFERDPKKAETSHLESFLAGGEDMCKNPEAEALVTGLEKHQPGGLCAGAQR